MNTFYTIEGTLRRSNRQINGMLITIKNIKQYMLKHMSKTGQASLQMVLRIQKYILGKQSTKALSTTMFHIKDNTMVALSHLIPVMQYSLNVGKVH